MKNAISKSIILTVAIAAAIGSVLFFVRYVVNPPEDISAKATAKDVFNPNIKYCVASFNPDSLGLKKAEVAYDALVDRATIFNNDKLIDKKVYDNAIVESSEKFAKSFISWSIGRFNRSSWYATDHEVMRRLIAKMRKVSIDKGTNKALSPETMSSLTEIESVVNDYKKAWSITENTTFSGYQNVIYVCSKARMYAAKKYLSNCASLVNALNAIGKKQEVSCYNQLYRTVERLQHPSDFEDRKAYETESRRIYRLIKEFKETNVFGISTENHAQILARLQDRYDRNAEDYEWPDEKEESENQTSTD